MAVSDDAEDIDAAPKMFGEALGAMRADLGQPKALHGELRVPVHVAEPAPSSNAEADG